MVTTVFDFYPRDPERRKEIDKGKEIRRGKRCPGARLSIDSVVDERNYCAEDLLNG